MTELDSLEYNKEKTTETFFKLETFLVVLSRTYF